MSTTPKGLDSLAKDFLFNKEGDEHALLSDDGQDRKGKQLEKWVEYRITEFIERAGSLTEDTMAYYTDLIHKRGLDNVEGIFALALMTINLRNAYGYEPRSKEESQDGIPDKVAQERLQEFDKICYYAQKYYDENK